MSPSCHTACAFFLAARDVVANEAVTQPSFPVLCGALKREKSKDWPVMQSAVYADSVVYADAKQDLVWK